jgi:hypothetical protein
MNIKLTVFNGKTTLLLLSLLPFFSCQKPDFGPLQKLSVEELVQQHQDSVFSLSETIFRSEDGRNVSEEEVAALKEGTLAIDYYVDSLGVIREGIVRKASFEDYITRILIANIDFDPAKDVPVLSFNCDSLKYQMRDVYKFQQEEWSGYEESNPLGFFDFERAKIVSIVNQCGFPNVELLGKKGLSIFWLMIQHSEAPLMAHYYLEIKRLVKEGDLHEEDLALTTDRLLMNNDYLQVYGSQLLNGELYPIENAETVDQRRDSLGLASLEEYLEYF